MTLANRAPQGHNSVAGGNAPGYFLNPPRGFAALHDSLIHHLLLTIYNLPF
jgi:hypothetical protein